jgi:hypothetical protein
VLAAAVLILATVPFLVDRGTGVPTVMDEVVARDVVIGGLGDAIGRAGGREVVTRCGVVRIDDYGIAAVALAWELDLPLADVKRATPGAGGITFVATDPEHVTATSGRRPAPIAGPRIARTDHWDVVGSPC